MRSFTFTTVLLLTFTAQAEAHADDTPDPAALLFAQKCATCHNLGGGKKVGPDLLGVTDRRDKAWFTSFVKNPGALIDSKDSVASELFAEYGVRMPELGLTDADAEGLWSYFAACTQKGGCTPVSVGPKWGTDGSAEDIAEGKALFYGEHRFTKGGPPCFVCHNARDARALGGGSLGPDLTFAYARLGETRIEPQLVEMATPVMNAVYAKAPLSQPERFAVKAYLADLSRRGDPPRREHDFFWMGLEGMGLVLGAFVLAWDRKRAGRKNR